MDELPHLSGHRRAAVRGESHHLVLVLVDGKSEIRRERRVQETQRMREPDLALQRDVGDAVRTLLAVTGRERRPFAHAIRGEDGRAPGRRGQKRGCGMRGVVIGEEDLLPPHAELRRDDAAHPHFLAEGVLDRVWKRPPRSREGAQRAGENPLELEHAALVEDHRIEIRRVEAGVVEAPLDRARRKGGVVLPAREPLLLYGADGRAVHHQRGGRIVVVRRDPEDLHVRYRLRGASSRARETGVHPTGARRSARFASQANGGSRTKYMIVSTTPPSSPAGPAARRR